MDDNKSLFRKEVCCAANDVNEPYINSQQRIQILEDYDCPNLNDTFIPSIANRLAYTLKYLEDKLKYLEDKLVDTLTEKDQYGAQEVQANDGHTKDVFINFLASALIDGLKPMLSYKIIDEVKDASSNSYICPLCYHRIREEDVGPTGDNVLNMIIHADSCAYKIASNYANEEGTVWKNT